MGRSGSRSVLLLAVLIAIALGSASSAAWAQTPIWTKLYDCTNNTADTKHGIQVQLLDREEKAAEYGAPQFTCTCPAGPGGKKSCWLPAEWSTDLQPTKITYPGDRTKVRYRWSQPPGSGLQGSQLNVMKIEPGDTKRIGWRTVDNHCRLTNICWLQANGDPWGTFEPTRIDGVHGGGVAFYNYPEPGDLTLAITNDYTDPSPRRDRMQLGLSYADVDYAISRVPLYMERQLERHLSGGFQPPLKGKPLTSLPGPDPSQWPPKDESLTRALRGSAYVPWPSIDRGRLYPGQYTVLVIERRRAEEEGVARPDGWALIIRGALEDAAGHEFRWLEQIVAGQPPREKAVGSESRGGEPRRLDDTGSR
jgi:hypothetical protein